MNQIEASFLKDNNAFGNITKTRVLTDEFINGRKGNLSQHDELFVNEIKEELGMSLGWYFSETSRQTCNNLFIGISFRGMNIKWNQIDEEALGPTTYQTDFGACCLLTPHLDLKPLSSNLTTEEIYHQLDADTLNGEIHGLDMILDAEQFNYAYYHSNAAGFKIALHHHLDKPMMQFSSQLINTGTETQVNLKPTISYTTEDAIATFSPNERGCYVESEVNLTYLTHETGFRYEMNNCLIDGGIRDIIWNCRCMPNFGYYEEYLEFIPICTGQKLFCAKTWMKTLGMKNEKNESFATVQEARENPNMIGNITKPDVIDCLPACQVQDNFNQMTYAPYPQEQNFFYQETFCSVASHIWQSTCKHESRAYFMMKSQPKLCPILESFQEFFDIGQIMIKNHTVSLYQIKIKRIFG